MAAYGPALRIRAVTNPTQLAALRDALAGAQGVVLDVETSGLEEFQPGAHLKSMALLVFHGPGEFTVWALPLQFRSSPWLSSWREVIQQMASWTWPKKVVAQNGKFDLRWLRAFGLQLKLTFDTMLAGFLLDENRSKGLKEMAVDLLGAKPWGVDTTNLDSLSIQALLRYNALDVYWTYQLYLLFRRQLAKLPKVNRLFQKVIIPASNHLMAIEEYGVYMDRAQLDATTREITELLESETARLTSFIPPREEWPEELQKAEVKFSANNWCRWWMFVYRGMPVLERGKPTKAWPEGPPLMNESVMVRLADDFPEVKTILEISKLTKMLNGFLIPYSRQLVGDRIHTSFKLSGTVTGRLSSGSIEGKITGQRSRNAGVNFQQVPRDKRIRGLFSVPPGHWWLEADYSQAELRIAAALAGEQHMINIYATGGDVHTTMAERMTNRAEVTSDERKKAKAVNFGFLYGMGWRKFIEYAKTNYGVDVTPREAQHFRKAFFDMFPGFPTWHERQRQLAHRDKQVSSPLGRIRHLPDVDSDDPFLVGSAERQAINAPVQGFASDMALAAFVRLCEQLEPYQARPLGLVHDALCFEVPEDELGAVAALVKREMEILPFGIDLGVPIVADVKVGKAWGDDQTDTLRARGLIN